jgi:predicted nucleic acid-binding Zn ribbon protein
MSLAVAPDSAQQRRRVRRSAIVWMLVAALFYFGFIVLTLVRAAK